MFWSSWWRWSSCCFSGSIFSRLCFMIVSHDFVEKSLCRLRFMFVEESHVSFHHFLMMMLRLVFFMKRRYKKAIFFLLRRGPHIIMIESPWFVVCIIWFVCIVLRSVYLYLLILILLLLFDSNPDPLFSSWFHFLLIRFFWPILTHSSCLYITCWCCCYSYSSLGRWWWSCDSDLDDGSFFSSNLCLSWFLTIDYFNL